MIYEIASDKFDNMELDPSKSVSDVLYDFLHEYKPKTDKLDMKLIKKIVTSIVVLADGNINVTHSELSEHLTLTKRDYAKDGFFLRAESLYNAATYIDEVKATHNYGNISLHNQSHGESFLSIVQNRFSGNGLYLLDEPEAALSPMRLMTLIVEMDRLLKNNSQFIIATHSPILMAFPNAEMLQFSESGIEKVKYYETEHYKTTKLFIEKPEKMIQHLIDSNN